MFVVSRFTAHPPRPGGVFPGARGPGFHQRGLQVPADGVATHGNL